MGTDHEHRVATYAEAEAAIRSHDIVYLNACFCREPAKEGKAPYPYCGHAIDTCMGFHERLPDWPEYDYREISQAEALAIFRDWKEAGRIFRFMEDESWICCCCACGCGWFFDKEGNRQRDPCKKSPVIESTDTEACQLCGDCVEVCAWDARALENHSLVVNAEDCYGCSACEPVCPESAIAMVPRA
ncbi:MAG: ATP-binding protein [Planctomycetota bacterium]|jgi:NAD-dependent dihydropyrimidine dehydrogenase PreA subunit